MRLFVWKYNGFERVIVLGGEFNWKRRFLVRNYLG